MEGKDAMCMIEDREGWLWIGTNLGLYRYDKKSTIVPYTVVDGLPSSVFITCCPVIDEMCIRDRYHQYKGVVITSLH